MDVTLLKKKLISDKELVSEYMKVVSKSVFNSITKFCKAKISDEI